MMEYEEFCSTTYTQLYSSEFARSLAGRTSEAAIKNVERSAQKLAIKETLKLALNRYSSTYEAAQIWRAIYVAHLKRKAGVNDLNVINEDIISRVISADQSWKKSSGHVFESYIKEIANPSLEQYAVKFVLQKDLNHMIQNNDIHNDTTDMARIRQRIHTDVFDLYAISSWQSRNYVFGCIQSKTSIRDRVTRDREPSRQAMNEAFWSVAVTLDGAFLAMPKFQEMVNGGGNDYPENGWHGLYVMSNNYTCDRIYPVDKDLTLLVEHARLASEEFSRARQRFSHTWRPPIQP